MRLRTSSSSITQRSVNRYFRVLGAVGPLTRRLHQPVVHQCLVGSVRRRFGRPSIGLLVADRDLGWANARSVTVRHPDWDFRAVYSTDGEGCRRGVPTASEDRVQLLGSSWTFGHGVDDHETFGSALGRRGFDVTNRAVLGYGLANVYCQAMTASLADDAQTVIYGWIPEHLERMWRRRQWIEMCRFVPEAERWQPVFDLVGGRPSYQGLGGLDATVSELGTSADMIMATEWRLGELFLSDLARHFESAGVRFIVALLGDGTGEGPARNARIAQIASRHGIELVDVVSEGRRVGSCNSTAVGTVDSPIVAEDPGSSGLAETASAG